MKKVTSLVVVGAMLAAGSAAVAMDDMSFSVGADYYQAWMKASGTFPGTNINASDAFADSFPGATVYVGAKFMENFGVEIGGDWSSSKSSTASGTSGATAFTYTNKIRREGYHVDLVGFLPLVDCWELFANLGYGSVKAKVSDQSLTTNGAVSTAGSTSTGSNGVLRLGVGASWMLTDMFGLRAKLGWEGTDNLRVKYTNGTESKLFKNSTTFALGAFVRW